MLAPPQFGSDAFRVGALGIGWLCVTALLFGLGTAPLIGAAHVVNGATTPTQLIGATGLIMLGIGSAGCTLSEQLAAGQRALSFVLLAGTVVSFVALLYAGSGEALVTALAATISAVLIWAVLDSVRDRSGPAGPVWLATGVCLAGLTFLLLMLSNHDLVSSETIRIRTTPRTAKREPADRRRKLERARAMRATGGTPVVELLILLFGVARAGIIIVRVGDSPGLAWEVEGVVAQGKPGRVLLGLPLAGSAERKSRYASFRTQFEGVFPRALPAQADHATFIYFDDDWTPRMLCRGDAPKPSDVYGGSDRRALVLEQLT